MDHWDVPPLLATLEGRPLAPPGALPSSVPLPFYAPAGPILEQRSAVTALEPFHGKVFEIEEALTARQPFHGTVFAAHDVRRSLRPRRPAHRGADDRTASDLLGSLEGRPLAPALKATARPPALPSPEDAPVVVVRELLPVPASEGPRPAAPWTHWTARMRFELGATQEAYTHGIVDHLEALPRIAWESSVTDVGRAALHARHGSAQLLHELTKDAGRAVSATRRSATSAAHWTGARSGSIVHELASKLRQARRGLRPELHGNGSDAKSQGDLVAHVRRVPARKEPTARRKAVSRRRKARSRGPTPSTAALGPQAEPVAVKHRPGTAGIRVRTGRRRVRSRGQRALVSFERVDGSKAATVRVAGPRSDAPALPAAQPEPVIPAAAALAAPSPAKPAALTPRHAPLPEAAAGTGQDPAPTVPPGFRVVRSHLTLRCGAVEIAETDGALLRTDLGGDPVFYVPMEDVRQELLDLRREARAPDPHGQRDAYDLLLAGRRTEGAAWTHSEPSKGSGALVGYFAFDPKKVDAHEGKA